MNAFFGKIAGIKKRWVCGGLKEIFHAAAWAVVLLTAVCGVTGCGRELEERDFPEVLVIRETPLADVFAGEQEKSSKYLDYGQVKCVVLRQDIAEDEAGRRDVLTCLEGMPVFARNILIFAGTEDVLEQVEMKDKGIGSSLEGFYKNVPGRSREDAVTLGELLNWLHNGDADTVIPLLTLREGELVPEGGIELETSVPAGNFARWKE